MNYPLYHTLNKNVSDSELTEKENTLLLEKIVKANVDKKKAVILLIIEHAKEEGIISVSPEEIELPYGLSQKGEDVHIPIEKLPTILKRILLKFLK